MNLILRFRERLEALSHPLVLELEQLLLTIRTAFRAQHADDGTHGAITATSVTAPTLTGALTGNVTGAVTGNASTATTLQTTRTIWGQNFNGGANVTGALSAVTTIAHTVAAPGVDTAATHWQAAAASANWPIGIASIYDANYVDHFLTFNGALGGSRAAATLTVPGGATAAWWRFDPFTGTMSYATRSSTTGAPTTRLSIDVAGALDVASYKAGGVAGYSGTVVVRDAAGTGTTSLTFVGGILTAVA